MLQRSLQIQNVQEIISRGGSQLEMLHRTLAALTDLHLEPSIACWLDLR
jgi:hypothetical protein